MTSHDAAFSLIGVIHLPPLPGAPRATLSAAQVVARALSDADVLSEGGMDGVVIENFGDAPFASGSVEPHVPALLAVIGASVRARHPHLRLGLNVLRNDARSALAAAVACGAEFIRVNVHTGATWTDQGLLQGDAYGTLRYRAQLGSTVRIAADVAVKHGVPAGITDLEALARDTQKRGLADILIVTGARTGAPTATADLDRVRSVGGPVWVGSGVDPQSLPSLRAHADGAIVGTWLHRDGDLTLPLALERVRALVAARD